MKETNFKHFPSENSNINTMIQSTETSEIRQSSHHSLKSGPQKYLFEFGSDDNIYLVFFKGNLSHEDIYMMLESAHQKLYADCGRSIYTYLAQNRIKYSCLKMDVSMVSHQEIMNQAERPLQSCPHAKFDDHIDLADNYFAVMDHQIQTPDGGCEGCYYAIKKSVDDGNCHCHIIGQTFVCDKLDNIMQGYFAIRTGQGGQELHDLDTKTGELVLPSFGCIDIMSILINIDNICSFRQAEEIALK